MPDGAVVGTALGGHPGLSFLVSAAMTTALLGVLYRRLKQSRGAAHAEGEAPTSAS